MASSRRFLVGAGLSLIVTLTLLPVAGSGSASTRERKIASEMDKLVAAGAPGVIVLFRDGDQMIQLARGFADVARKTPMRASDRFRIASLTKSFIAVVVLQLVGERRLSLDDTVQTHLADLVPNADKITIRHLLNHTSGIFDYWNDQSFFQRLIGEPTRTWTPQERIAVATAHKPLFAPGTGWSYSNTGYILLGLIVEKVTGHTLSQELRERIFLPLDLRATSAPATHQIEGRHAHGYFVVDKPPPRDVTGVSASVAWGHGDIVSTASDVSAFYRALLGGRILRVHLLQAMETTVATTYAGGQRYGLGIVTGRLSCGSYWGHDGEFAGYLTTANNSKDGIRQVVIMVNSSSLSNAAKKQLNRLLESAYCG